MTVFGVWREKEKGNVGVWWMADAMRVSVWIAKSAMDGLGTVRCVWRVERETKTKQIPSWG